jgi:outer membrane protein assembly factor BamB
VLWKQRLGAAVRGSAAVSLEGNLFVGTEDGTLYGLGPEGRVVSAHKTGGALTSSPAIGPDGMVVVGSQDGKVWGFW